MATKRKYKTKRYNGEFGSDVDAANASEDPIASLNKSRGWTDTEESAAAPEKKMSFKEAFAAARKAGDKTFEWQGKKYTTEMASPSKPKADTQAAVRKTEPRVAAYETPFDRARREDREQGRDIGSVLSRLKDRVMGAGDRGQERILRDVRPGATNPKTMLPMKKGGAVKSASASKRADGIAQRGKTRGRVV